MKSPAAYYLMLLYITVMIKPLIPIIQNEWAHQFNEIEHISCVHAKYGNNHLEKELAGANTDDKTKSQNTVRAEDQVPFHIVTAAYKYNISFYKPPISYCRLNYNRLPFVYISCQGKPPEF